MTYQSKLDHLANHDCERCHLHQTTERVCVMGRGDPASRVMLIGEAPGANEAMTGKVFSGPAGKLLNYHMQRTGLSELDPYITNVVKCRPPDNRRPDRVEFEACRRYLEREAKAIKPKFVMLLGNAALQAVARKSGITTKRGVRLTIKDPVWAGAQVMATIHPAYVLRNPGQSTVFAEDIARFTRMIRGQFQVVPVKVKYCNTTEAVKYVRRKLLAAPPGTALSYDVENRGRPWDLEWDIVCLGVSFDGRTAYVIPLSHPDSPFRKSWKGVLRFLGPGLARHGLGPKLVGQNAKHDNLQLAGAGIFLEHNFDIMLAAHLLDENRPKNLGFLSQSVLGADVYKGMVETKPDKIMKEPIKRICEYNGYDTGYTHQIYPHLRRELLAQPRLTRLYSKLLMPASHVIQQVEMAGVYVDKPLLWRRIKQLQREIDERKGVLYEHLPKKWPNRDEFNFNSTQQLGRWLFSRKGLGLSPLELTKSGAPSTKEAVLLHYHDHPAVKALLEYRTLQLKWMNTNFLPWSTKLDAKSRLHTTYKLYGTVTGRVSGDLQQVPRDSFVREVFGAPEGWRFVTFDYSQIELRIAAHVANERRMKRAFQLGEDLHAMTASSITGKPKDKVGKEERKMAKPVNFGFLYGMYPKKFVAYAFENYGVDFTLAEAELAREKYFTMFADLEPWHERQKRIANSLHRVSSPLGRIRHLPDILSSDNSVRMEAERQAINSPVQSCASDLMLFSMVKLRDELDPRTAFMTMTLHDAIMFQVREDFVGEYMTVIQQVMENLPLKQTFGLDLSVPIVSEGEVGTHWHGTPDASGLGIVPDDEV